MSKIYLDLRICGQEEEIKEFIHLCKVIQYLGRSGSSRDITVSVDGDGSGRLLFQGIMPGGTLMDMNLEGIDANNLPRISIGE